MTIAFETEPTKRLPGTAGVLVEGLSKSFGTTEVLRGIDFEVERGTILAVLGPNGAGKTTTVRILTTLLRADSGRALVGGYEVAQHPMQVRSVIGLTGQDTSVDGMLTGRENLVMIGRLLRLGTKAARRRADELLDQLDLGGASDRRAKTYSGGMRRRLDLAASLVGNPDIMFLDEPTTGLDPLARQKVWGIVQDLVKQGTTVLLTTQYMEEADLLADRIVVIDNGEVIMEGTPKALKSRVGSERAELVFADSEELHAAVSLLAEAGAVRADAGTSLELTLDDPWGLHDLLGRLRQSGLKPLNLTVTQPTLDDVFLTVTGSRKTERIDTV